MFLNIFKICILFNIFNSALNHQVRDVSTTVLDVEDNNLEIEPFVKVCNKYYYFAEKKVSWFKAHLECRTIGGYLASVEGKEEFEEITEYMLAKYNTEIWWWVSGSDLDTDREFFWYRSGKPITYGWTNDQPDNAAGNEHCVHLWYQNKRIEMNDLQCDRQAYFVCEADKPKTIQVTIF